MRLKISIFLMIFGASQPLSAKNLGTYGEVFEIKEENILELIQKRLRALKKEGKMEALQKELQKKATAKISRPTPVDGLIKAQTYSRRTYNPTFMVSQDIKDHKGTLIAKKGETHNPLDTASFGIPLIFIDGDDEDQVQWAISQKGKIILINGAPLELEKLHKHLFYFDQGSVLVEKFDLAEVPARISQQGKHLLIESIPVSKGKANG